MNNAKRPVGSFFQPGGRQRGLTLIEILVTLLVLAIGLLGLAGLQGFSLQAGQVSYLRTQATNIGYEVADFARANHAVASSGFLDGFADELAAAQLPEGEADVNLNVNTGVLDISVTWLDDRSDDTPETATFTFNTRI